MQDKAQSIGAPFARFTVERADRSGLRRNITDACRRTERETVAPLIAAAKQPEARAQAIADTARKLIVALRTKRGGSIVESLMQEYALSSDEGVALMCLAEALLRIPDAATRDALIRDKVAHGDWQSHMGTNRSVFVNAATWGLAITGRLAAPPASMSRLTGALTRLVARAGEPAIRAGMAVAMKLLGDQFVMGQTIQDALARAKKLERIGFRYSYDMLGEAAMTAHDAVRYLRDYESAIHAIGKASAGRGVYEGPGISIKLSALHPRYARTQIERVMSELLPRVKALCLLAKAYDIGLNIDAEEADRLDISLDLFEALALDGDLDGWQGLGFVVQAYGKRCPFVLSFLIDLARRARRKIMVRLVKGAYWDAEIKKAQVEGHSDFPVFTRKEHTDVSYIACASQLLAARDAIFPQFATHNAQTLSSIYHIAGADRSEQDYEFQCLHGMGEPLYEEVVTENGLARPCRIYAPVGSHDTLLAYLVRRLLENGANASFVRRLRDPSVGLDELTRDPVAESRARNDVGAPHAMIKLPAQLYGPRRSNSAGLDLACEETLSALSMELRTHGSNTWRASPAAGRADAAPILNPSDHRDVVGYVISSTIPNIDHAVDRARLSPWLRTGSAERAAALLRAADALQEAMPRLLSLIMREAGKTAANGVAEIREAIDFLRYYADAAADPLAKDEQPLGVVAAISPWNFPLAIFIGQVTAALAAGNTVLAKPAEETPLIAAEAVRILHAAGVPEDAVQILPGDGAVGSALVASSAVQGVMFTGSTDVARLIQQSLARRLSDVRRPIPLIAETGGQNAMIVDSSALPEQVVADVLSSAFDSAGQRCSALRVLCLQEEAAERILPMLQGALAELSIAPVDRLSTDIGPVISAEARGRIEAHVQSMIQLGRRVHRAPLPLATEHGTFVAPTIIEINDFSELSEEVFGPVLHVIRYKRTQLDQTIEAINATGYGLTFGLHTRIADTVEHVVKRIKAGNIYVNRNIVGAVVGTQPFGGHGLSGTGPKAGGPLYLSRLTRAARCPACVSPQLPTDEALTRFADWLQNRGLAHDARSVRELGLRASVGFNTDLPGPVGESNRYLLAPRGRILLLPATESGLHRQIAHALSSGNIAVVEAGETLEVAAREIAALLADRVVLAGDLRDENALAGALIEGNSERIIAASMRLAARPGLLIPVQSEPYDPSMLMQEVAISTNTTAAGGNASLMALA